MGLECEIAYISKLFVVSFFDVDAVVFSAHYRMAEIAHEIEIDVALLLYIGIHLVIQVFECHLLGHNLLYLVMKLLLHDKAGAPFFVFYFVYVGGDDPIFYNYGSGVIAPCIAHLGAKVYSDDIVCLYVFVRCLILSAGNGYERFIAGENKSTDIPVPEGIRAKLQLLFLFTYHGQHDINNYQCDPDGA